MSHPQLPLGTPRETRNEILAQMLGGGGIAAMIFVGFWLFFYAIYAVGQALPPESKQADDPTPDSFSTPAEPQAMTDS